MNIATGMDAYQSVTTRWSATKGADGDRDPKVEGGGCTTSPYFKSYKTYNWWKVDLQYVYDIKLVIFLNQGDCCGELYISAYSVLIHQFECGHLKGRKLSCLLNTYNTYY